MSNKKDLIAPPKRRRVPKPISATAQPEVLEPNPKMIPFAEHDLSAWGIMEPSEENFVRMQARISERHNLIVEAFARKRRMTNRGALERVIEKFVESGEFARLMDQHD